MGGLIAWRPGRAAREGDDAIDSQRGRKADRVAKVRIMFGSHLRIRMERVAPGIQRADPQTTRCDLAQPGCARSRVMEQKGHVAMGRWCVSTGADLKVGDVRHLARQPIQDIDQRPARQRLGHDPDAKVVPVTFLDAVRGHGDAIVSRSPRSRSTPKVT
jgi:hypothetical protein